MNLLSIWRPRHTDNLSVCPSKIRIHSPVLTSQMRMVLSSEGEARYLPSGDQAMRFIAPVCPRKTWRRVSPGTGEPPISVKSFGVSVLGVRGLVKFCLVQAFCVKFSGMDNLRSLASQQGVVKIPPAIVQPSQGRVNVMSLRGGALLADEAIPTCMRLLRREERSSSQ